MEALYGLLMGAILHSSISSIQPPPTNPHYTPSATTSKPSPQDPEEAVPKAFAPVAEVMEQRVAAPAVSPALEVAIPTQMTPLCLQLGASRGCINAGLRVAPRGLQPHRLLFVNMYAESTWDGVAMPLL